MAKRVILFSLMVVLLSCDSEEKNRGFSNEEIFPLISFTFAGDKVIIDQQGSPFFTNEEALNDKGDEIDGTWAKGFGLSTSGEKIIFSIQFNKWITEKDIDTTTYFDRIVKAGIFASTFQPGTRLIGKGGSPLHESDVVNISTYNKERGEIMSSRYPWYIPGDPIPYSEMQPNSNFTLLRSKAFGNDSMFVEAKFKVRLYKSNYRSSYIDIQDGYFKGFFYRK